MIFVNKLRLYEGRHLPVIIWLCLLFSSTWFGEVSQNFHNLWNLSSRSFKSRKKEGVTKAVFSLLAIFSSSISNLVLWFFLSTGTRKGTNMFNDPANMNFAEIYIWECVNFRICHLLAIFPIVFSFRLTSFSGVEGL